MNLCVNMCVWTSMTGMMQPPWPLGVIRSVSRAERVNRARQMPIVFPVLDTYCISSIQRERPIMSVTLHRWGNSVGLRLPKPLLDQLGLKQGSEVDIRIEGNRLVVEPAHRRRYTMAELLEGITPDNRPEEVDWGPPVGREVW
jgi:antitoxin MazE